MEQVYIFKSKSVRKGLVKKLTFPGLAYDCRDVHAIFTSEELTSLPVLKEVYLQHYFPWCETIRRMRTGADNAVIVSSTDSDPEQFKFLQDMKAELDSKHYRVTMRLCY
jgi:hypothetical protein